MMEDDEEGGINWKPKDADPLFQDFLRDRRSQYDLAATTTDGIDDVPVPQTWRHLSHKPYMEHSWRIKGLVPGEGFVILASVSGEKKTWVGLDMARCITSNIDFLGDERFKTDGCNVLYLNCENPESEIQRRGRQLGFPEEGEHELYILNSDGLNLRDDNSAYWLMGFIEYYDIGVVFIDTFRAVAGVIKEEKAEEIREFFNRFASLKNKGVTIVWLDHLRKPSNLDGKIPKKEHLLGSQDKCASVETLLMIKSEEGSESVNCYQRKNRLALEVKPFQILMKDEVGENGNIRTKLSFGGEIIEEKESKKEEAKKLIPDFIAEEGKTTKEIVELLKKQIGAKNIRTALRELVDEKIIDFTRKGRENLYILVPEDGGKNIGDDSW